MNRVLVTGASGLLGSAIAQRLLREHGLWLLTHSTPLPGMEPIDLLTEDGLAAVCSGEWGAIVHCAAFRRPDYCEDNREAACLLNAIVPGRLAEEAARRDARMIHISTDYVFDGTQPPYQEDDERHPLNYYGETKMLAEDAVLATEANAVVLRVPALYGSPPPPIVSTLVDEGIAAAMSDTPCALDHTIVRYPTHTDDIAELVAFLLNVNLTGILQASAPEHVTRYEWALAVARVLGRTPDHLSPAEQDLDRTATRPVDAHFDTSRLASFGAPIPVGFSERLPALLKQRFGCQGCSCAGA